MYLAFRKVDVVGLATELGKVEWWFLALQAGMLVVLMGLGAWRWAGLILEKVGIDDWKVFVSAMVEQGTKNFLHSQYLKQLVAGCTTAEEVESVTWDTK